MPLTRCIECNHKISTSARSCPACSTPEPFGVDCELCEKKLPQSQSVTCKRCFANYESISIEWVELDRYAHKACIDRFFKPPPNLACPDCGLVLTGNEDDLTPRTLWSRCVHLTCPKCGATNALRCESCGLFSCMAPYYLFQKPWRGLGHGHPSRKEGCFVATAAYTSQHPTVFLLQTYRDDILKRARIGRAVVRLYNRFSPPLARLIEASRSRRFIARGFLKPVVLLARLHLRISQKA